MSKISPADGPKPVYLVILEYRRGKRTEVVECNLSLAFIQSEVGPQDQVWSHIFAKRHQDPAEAKNQFLNIVRYLEVQLDYTPRAIVLATSPRVYYLLQKAGINCVGVFLAGDCWWENGLPKFEWAGFSGWHGAITGVS